MSHKKTVAHHKWLTYVYRYGILKKKERRLRTMNMEEIKKLMDLMDEVQTESVINALYDEQKRSMEEKKEQHKKVYNAKWAVVEYVKYILKSRKDD
jgi:acyl-[acyl carrier protein]--UDP-N-acetylglucosamine O-acyltransferase